MRISDWSSDVCSSDLSGDRTAAACHRRRLCFVAGTTGYDPVTKVMPESAAEQAKNALGVIEKALGEAGFALADVVRATYYFTDTAYWDEVGPTLGAAFGDIRPAASAIVVGLVKPAMKDRKSTRLNSSH